ncbi:fatty-acyl-CoA synthase [Mumia flava]|uniref:Fatty-acyl-CoA synthase n=1 Tax=Mumia flava TaxID=1348852 RepID=A0A0B2BCR6_9ACTN|nr:long-chain fatty acid--CoA ligase [Mumia flava]PJJ57525.1 fatty-acyl-CoA synthase [Mumia flava]
MRNQGIGSWPARRSRSTPQATALVYGGRTTTYAALHARVTALAHALRARGIDPGDRVAYLGPNHPAFVETMFATHALGAIFVPLNFRLAAPEVAYMLDDSGASLLVHAPENADAVAALEAYAGARIALGAPGAGDEAYEDLLASSGADDDPSRVPAVDVPVAASDPALILYTSGTTGRPKGAVLTHDNLLANAINLLVDVDVATDEVTLVGAPLFHVAALDQTLIPTILKGGTCVIMPTWDVDACFDLIAEHRVTWMFGVSAMFAGLAQSPRWSGADLSSIRTVMSGGAPVPESLIRTYQERGLTFCQGYGMTETAPGATFLRPEQSIAKAGTAGTPCFFVDVRVVDADGADVAPGVPGEVLVAGANVTPGYWNRPDATAAAFTDGWLRTGDVATVDDDGYLTIVDRVKDMFISGGENVYPAEVEAVLFAHDGVAEAAVIGVPDERWGEVGAAYVVARPGARLDVDDLRAFARTRLAGYKVPAHWHLVDDLPRTGSGKVRKPDLRTMTDDPR